MEFKTGDTIRITDNATGAIVVQGKIAQIKPCNSTNSIDDTTGKYALVHRKYISCDFRMFFDTESKRYSVSSCNDNNVVFQIPQEYIVDAWKPENRKNTSADMFETIDVFVEHDITELDEEIKEFVYALNELGFVTTSSCCGHGGTYPHVIVCMNERSGSQLPRLQFLIKYLNNRFNDIVDIVENCLEINDFNKENEKGQFLVKVIVKYMEKDCKVILDNIADAMRDLKNVI